MCSPPRDDRGVVFSGLQGSKASLVQREVAEQSEDGGIVAIPHRFAEPPLHKGAFFTQKLDVFSLPNGYLQPLLWRDPSTSLGMTKPEPLRVHRNSA